MRPRPPLLEPPIMLTNYGHHTTLATVLAHIAYGAIVGGVLCGFVKRRWAPAAGAHQR